MMNLGRRTMLTGASALVLPDLVGIAHAQAEVRTGAGSPSALISILSTENLLLPVLVGVETIIYTYSVAFDNGEEIGRSLLVFRRLAADLFREKGRILETLKSPGYPKMMKAYSPIVDRTTERVVAYLEKADIQNGKVRTRLGADFKSTSYLLDAKSPPATSWWCQCYALRRLLC